MGCFDGKDVAQGASKAFSLCAVNQTKLRSAFTGVDSPDGVSNRNARQQKHIQKQERSCQKPINCTPDADIERKFLKCERGQQESLT